MHKINLLFALAVTLISSTIAFGTGVFQVTTQSCPYSFLYLDKTEIWVEINGQVAITTVEHTFNNPTTMTIDGLFHFPVPVTASVTGMGRYVDGELQLYTLIPGQQGGTGGGASSNPALEDYLGENPFSIQIADVEPGQLKLYFQFSGLLDYSFGDIIMTYPLYTPSYFLLAPIDTVNIAVTIESQRTITGASSQNYPQSEIVIIDDFNAFANLSLYNQYPPDDFDLIYSVNQEEIGCWLLTNTEPDSLPDSEDGYFLLIMEPGEIQVGDVVQKYFTFVMDKSGSMAGYKITQAKDAAVTCISLLDTADYFNIIDFNQNIYHFQPQPIQATPTNVANGIDYIEAIYAGGSTNINSALLEALNQQMGANSANQVIFLTDGQPTAGVTNISQILDNVQAANDDTAGIFCFGIGSDVNTQLLEGLALENWGAVFYIDPTGPISQEVINFFMSIMNPVFINVSVDYGIINTRDVYPPTIANIYYGSQTIIFGRYQNTGITTISLSGTVAGYDTTLVYPGFNFPEENPDNQFVPRMWAIAYIDYWLAWMAANGEEEEIIDMIIFLSLKYGILTPYTNYTPVEELCVIGLTGSPQGGGMLIFWQLNRMQPGVTFDIYRADNPNGPFIKLNSAPLSDYYFLDATAQSGVVYYYKIKVHSIEGDFFSQAFTVGQVPQEFILRQNYPNPFNTTTTITYSLPVEARVRLEIFNLNGQLVKVLTDEKKSAGTYECVWDGANENGNPASSGQYFYRLSAEPSNGGEKFSSVKKLVLLK